VQDLNRYRKEIAARLRTLDPRNLRRRPPEHFAGRGTVCRNGASMIPRHVPLVETTRGGTTECVHYGSDRSRRRLRPPDLRRR